VIEALKRCLQDSSAAVALWALKGLTSRAMPGSEQVAAIRQSLNLALRTEPAPPSSSRRRQRCQRTVHHRRHSLIVEHLKRILPDYRAQVDAKLSWEEIVMPTAPGVAAPRPGGLRGREEVGAAKRTQRTSPHRSATSWIPIKTCGA